MYGQIISYIPLSRNNARLWISCPVYFLTYCVLSHFAWTQKTLHRLSTGFSKMPDPAGIPFTGSYSVSVRIASANNRFRDQVCSKFRIPDIRSFICEPDAPLILTLLFRITDLQIYLIVSGWYFSEFRKRDVK